VLKPCEHETTARGDLGKWVSCVACDPNDDWLVSIVELRYSKLNEI